MRRTLPFLLTIFAPTLAHAEICSFSAARTALSEFSQTQGLPGAGILIGDRQGIYLENYQGGYTAQTVIAIASASKLLSGVRLLQLQDQGLLDLNAPVSSLLPLFTGEKGTMTAHQMFAHTSGYGDDSSDSTVFNSSITLAQAVDQIATTRPLNAGYTVGGQFSYGGVSMHIGGRMAEVATNRDWQTSWRTDLGNPLGISTIDWQGLGPTQNYGIAGSARSNLSDYGRFLHMLANRGRGNGKHMLRPSTVALLSQDRAEGLPVAYAPANVPPPARYSVGGWLGNFNDGSPANFIHSLGAFGFFPWVDFTTGRFGVFMIRGQPGINSSSIPVYREMLTSIQAELATGCTHTQVFEEIFVSGLER